MYDTLTEKRTVVGLKNEIQTALSENGTAVVSGVTTKAYSDVLRALVREVCHARNLDVSVFQTGDKLIIERVDRFQ